MKGIELRRDIQEAIINNVRNYYGDYGSLFFEENSKEHFIECFDYMEKLKISLKDNKLLYNITLYQEVLETFRQEKILEEVKSSYEDSKAKHNSIKNLVNALNEDELIQAFLPNTDGEEELLEIKDYDGYDINNMQMLQSLIKKFLGINTILKKGECFISLEAIVPEINFNKQQIIALSTIIKVVDIFYLSPFYLDKKDTNNNEAKNIRLFFAKNLEYREED